MTDVGFAVVGLGMGRGRAQTVAATAGARLVTVVDINESLAEKVGRELDCKWTAKLEDALDDDAVDVVLILTPSGLHGEMAIRVLEAGKHAITTKPMEVTLAKCDAMIAAAEKAGKLLGVDFETRYRDPCQKIRYALDHGHFGQPILAEARLKWYRSQKYYDSGGGWRGTWKLDGGGALANQSIHGIDLILWLMGRPKRVHARTGTFAHQIETEDLGMAMIDFASGAVGTILGTTTFPADACWKIEIHGSEGGAVVDFSGETKWFFLDGMADRQEKLQRLTAPQNIVEDVISALCHGTPLLCDGDQGRLSIELLTAVYESARNGGLPVDLPQESDKP